MYSKKVMQLFQHPHNMGKIKNPAGVGTVGLRAYPSPRTLHNFLNQFYFLDFIIRKFCSPDCGACVLWLRG
jgi:hypothetical protein